MAYSLDRLAHQIQKELSIMLINDIKDTKIGYITITEVRLTNDLSYAYIYFTIMGGKDRIDVALEGLNRAKGYMKNEIAKKVKMRKVPEFVFKYDESLEYGNKIGKMIDELK